MIRYPWIRTGLAVLLISSIVACGGGGSSTTTGATPTPTPVVARTPLAVKKSSYENKIAAAEVVGSRALPREINNGLAYADFFQEGEYSLVGHTLEYNFKDRSTSNKFGHIHFYKSLDGQWVDKTSDILGDTVGCLHVRKAIVADFNRDGKPDVLFACHGFDAMPFPGEALHLLLSQADGKYRNVTLPFSGFFHGASAADINGDGYPDIVVTDFISNNKPFFLINNKDGTFTADATRLPSVVNNKPMFSAELIDFNGAGTLDLFLGGQEQQPQGAWPAAILRNDGHGNFAALAPLVLPSLPGYGYPLDIVFTGGNIYLDRTIDDGSNYYGGAAIQRISYPSLASTVSYTHSGSYPNGTSWINWIAPFAGKIVSMDSLYGLSIPQ